jgi:hypothetical protein
VAGLPGCRVDIPIGLSSIVSSGNMEYDHTQWIVVRDRIEITMMRMHGPDLDYVDNRLLGVQLVKNGMTSAMMFDRFGKVQQRSLN